MKINRLFLGELSGHYRNFEGGGRQPQHPAGKKAQVGNCPQVSKPFSAVIFDNFVKYGGFFSPSFYRPI